MKNGILAGGSLASRFTRSKPRSSARKTPYFALLVSGALVISAFSLKFLPTPFVWIGLVWAGTLIGGLFCFEGSWPRAILFNMAFALVLLTAAEVYLSVRKSAFDPPTYSDTFFVKDDVLGTVPLKNSRTRSSSKSFDVTYTIDSNGLRIAPPTQKDKHAGCILFFGCSFTFGHGLADTETMPYQVGIQSGGLYRPINFAFQGYGAHQMLAMIEKGRVGRIVDGKPRYAIYSMITDHVSRAVGKVPYGKNSPRYVLDPDANVRLAGNFEQPEKKESPFEAELKWQLGKSAIYRTLAKREPRASEDDVRLTLALVRRSRDLLEAEYPGIQFHVLLWRPWDKDAEIYRELQDGLRKMNIPVHLVENILPGFTLATSSKYAISGTEGHPNALADRIIANYVLTHIVSPESEADISQLPASTKTAARTDKGRSYPAN